MTAPLLDAAHIARLLMWTSIALAVAMAAAVIVERAVAALQQSRGRLWRYPPGTRGRRHADHAQEEVFVVLAGTLTMHLGDPPVRVELPPESVVAVEPGTALQARNDGTEEAVVFIYGAPPVQEGADFFEDA